MKRFYEKCMNNLRYGGLKKEEYQEIEQEILEKDRSSLSLAAICLLLMFAGLFIGSLFSEMMAPNRTIYFLVGICFAGIWFLCEWMKKRGKRFIIPLWYVAMTLMIGYALILNTVLRNDISATTFCIIIIVAPLLVMDRPWRVFCYFCLMILIFIPIDFRHKAYYLAFTDTVNAVCCLFIGSVVHASIIRTKLREMAQKRYIEQQRDTDKLTGCMTKAAFEQKVRKSLGNPEHSGMLLVMDIDHFKNINDSYGHIFGDLVLRTIGERLHETFTDKALYGRFGGDEFQVWISGKMTRKDMIEQLKKLFDEIHAIQTPYGRIRVGISVGVALCPENGENYEVLFENADAALYSAKNLGRDRYVFCPEICMRSQI